VHNTQQNLKTAFAGESQASRRYLYYAEKADREGHPQVARLFRAASEAETVHARNHLAALQGVGQTADNLKAAAAGEHYEFTLMYPPFIEQAAGEDEPQARRSFDLANQVEEIHHALFQEALAAVSAGGVMPAGEYYVCQVCGNTVLGEAPEICPICGASHMKFRKVE
jgi:rubrerythrin